MTKLNDMEGVAIKSAYELEREKPLPSKNHAIVQGNIYFNLRLSYGKKYVAVPEISIIINGKERVPDIGIFKKLEYTPGDDEIRVTDVPAGVVEILSPNQAISELITKSVQYFEEGIQSYWLVLPDLKTVYVFNQPMEYEVFAKNQQLTDKLLGITLELTDIFK